MFSAIDHTMRICLLLLIWISAICSETSLQAQTLPVGFSRVKVGNIANASAMAFAPDGRIFVAQQAGSVRVFKNDQLLAIPFVTLTVDGSGERGLLGIAFDPDFSNNGYVYFYYTLPDGSHNRIVRIAANGDEALQGSETIVLDLDSLTVHTNHNGGALQFGPDGKLYVAVGENGIVGNSQSTDHYNGKILRINPDGSIPAGNPFTDGSEQRERIWAFGLRNPFTFDFQEGTGKFYVNDVGQDAWEEINDATTGGLNFGWPLQEGQVNGSIYSNPVYTYAHGSGDGLGCAITGGTFFDPQNTSYPAEYYGQYFFMDFCNTWINFINPEPGAVKNSFATAIGPLPVGLGVSLDGNLYYLARTNAGALYKIIYNSSLPPSITMEPSSKKVDLGQTAQISVSVSGSQPMQFQWKKNGISISNATDYQLTLTDFKASDVGQYTVEISNSFGSITSNNSLLSINGLNLPPVVAITLPLEGAMYRAGDLLSFSGNGFDPEEGELPDSAFSWQIEFQVNNQVREYSQVYGSTGEFLIPTSGAIYDSGSYRLNLIAKDKEGATGTVFRVLEPYRSSLKLHTDPEGLQIRLDTQNVQTPVEVVSVEGLKHEIGVTTVQQLNGRTYVFDRWASGKTDTLQFIFTPREDTTCAAIFKEVLITHVNDNFTEPIKIYPNPMNHYLILENLPVSEIRMVDISGKTLKEVSVFEKTPRMVLNPTLSAGFYCIIISSGNQVYRYKLLVSLDSNP